MSVVHWLDIKHAVGKELFRSPFTVEQHSDVEFNYKPCAGEAAWTLVIADSEHARAILSRYIDSGDDGVVLVLPVQEMFCPWWRMVAEKRAVTTFVPETPVTGKDGKYGIFRLGLRRNLNDKTLVFLKSNTRRNRIVNHIRRLANGNVRDATHSADPATSEGPTEKQAGRSAAIKRAREEQAASQRKHKRGKK